MSNVKLIKILIAINSRFSTNYVKLRWVNWFLINREMILNINWNRKDHNQTDAGELYGLWIIICKEFGNMIYNCLPKTHDLVKLVIIY